MRPLLLAAAVLLASPGCQTIGPRAVQYGRSKFNMTVQSTDGEQVLLNLVRLRYRDPPLFLDVTSIASSLSLELGANVNGRGGVGGPFVAPGGSVFYAEKPTITYAPLHGERFSKQLLVPIDVQALLLLYHSGWAIDRVLKVFVQRLGPLPNAPRASGPTPDREPRYQDFFRACEILRGLWADGMLELGYTTYGSDPVIAMNINPTLATRPEVAELARLLGLGAPTTTLLLSPSIRPDDPNLVAIVPRSLLGGMYYASQGVEVPDADLRAGRVTRTLDLNNRTFDWRAVTGDIMRVRSSKRRPPRAYVSVEYRDRWWYIADEDLDSKSTFSFLSQALEMLSGDVKTGGPVLTLPISAG